MRWKILGLVAALIIASPWVYSSFVYKPIPKIPTDLQAELTAYLESYKRAPLDYVAGKFDHHDIVFLGEAHRMRHDVEFVQQAIPVLHLHGVTNLAIEFGSADLQAIADSLVTAPTYDEEAARNLVFKHKVYWGYREYIDLYKAAWEVNRELQPGEKAFRIVHLDYSPDFTLVREDMTDELWQRVFYKGDTDLHMAEVLEREVLAGGEQALVYCGRNHSFTRFHQPVLNKKTEQVAWYHDRRLGNLIYDRIGDRAITILLHSSWDGDYPVGGAIDRVCWDMGNGAVAFDTQGTPFGGLRDTTSVYSRGNADFDLETICDGYVFLKPFVEFEGCRADPDFVNERNFEEAVARYPTLSVRKLLRSEWIYENILNWDASPKHRIRNLTG